jgi:hypothetical protein
MFWRATPLGVRIGSDWFGKLRKASDQILHFTGANGAKKGQATEIFLPPHRGDLGCYLLPGPVCKGFASFSKCYQGATEMMKAKPPVTRELGSWVFEL